MTSLRELFPDTDFRLHLTLRRAAPEEYFQRQDPRGSELAERCRWLAKDPARYSALTPEAEPMVAEFARECVAWSVVGDGGNGIGEVRSTSSTLRWLGETLEPDFVFLSLDGAGQFRLRGGVLCFPTGWSLEEKLGHPMDFIHGTVPGLNAALGSPINQFLGRLKPGPAFLRDNWGIAASNELNQHPARGLPAPRLPVRLDQLWLRVEHQSLHALPVTGGIVFAIRISNHRLDALRSDPVVAAGLARALETMPAEMAVYKRLDAVRTELVQALRQS